MRLFVLIIFLHVALFSANNVNIQIITNQKSLTSASKIEKKISRLLNDIARGIKREEKKYNNNISQIKNLQKQIARNFLIIKDKESNLKDLTNQNLDLLRSRKDLEDKIIKIIAEDFGFYLISDKDYLDSRDSIIVGEVVNKMGVIAQKEFNTLSKNYEKVNRKIDVQNRQIDDIKFFIKDLKNKKTKLYKLKKDQKKSIEKLASQKNEYKKRLLKIEKERNELRATLEKLHIIKVSQKQKRAAAEKKRIALLKQNSSKNYNSKLTVRQIGSSYQRSRVKKYRGKKTISPLDRYTVKRAFGNYTDPIYKIKIFNESIILKSLQKNAKVKNVLDGKVIYAKDTTVLKNVVIVENSYGIHTIYSHMDKIAPTIKVGKKIKKGYIIGRVEEDLSFEVTQKSYHINPLDLIR